jgi:acetyl esterase/lipase
MIKTAYLKAFTVLVLFLSAITVTAQTSCPGFPNMVQVKRPNISISPYINGFLEYTPPGYNPAGTTLYPLIIYFHGLAETGTGSSTDLCKILSLNAPAYTDNNPFDIPLPERIERGELPSVTHNSVTYNYIVLSPQYTQYNYPSAYPSAADVSAMIDYALANYKVDPGRIYLTGMSSGANMVMEYAASSLANARRVAGIALSSLCSSVGNFPNGPTYIATANLPVWAVHCITDDFPGTPGCPDTLVNNWINRINSNVPPPTPLAKKTTLGTAGQPSCNTGFTHNTWNTLYDPAFVVDGRNIYNWFIQYSRTGGGALPANVKNYNAVLRGSKVYVEWITTGENNTSHFVLERANANSQYQEVASITAAGASLSEKKYVLVDEQPVKGLNLYRLVLVNRDGGREYFDIKRITLPGTAQGYVNIPVPVRGTMSVYVNVDRSQNVRITVHDVNGKLRHNISRQFAPGLTENRIDVSSLSAGTYFVKVEGQYFTETRKIVKE